VEDRPAVLESASEEASFLWLVFYADRLAPRIWNAQIVVLWVKSLLNKLKIVKEWRRFKALLLQLLQVEFHTFTDC
jgi:hypothetical protein